MAAVLPRVWGQGGTDFHLVVQNPFSSGTFITTPKPNARWMEKKETRVRLSLYRGSLEAAGTRVHPVIPWPLAPECLSCLCHHRCPVGTQLG